MKLIVAMTGASGAIFGIRLLEYLQQRADIETHLILSRWAKETIAEVPGTSVESVQKLADYVYNEENLAAPISSGSFYCDAMVIIPCSMKTLAAAAMGLNDTLIVRAADVSIKEKRPLILVVRETPLSPIHLENMLKLAKIGATIMPPVPAFYGRKDSVSDLVDFFIGRLLTSLGIENELYEPWQGEII